MTEPPAPDLRHLDPEVRKERVKMVAGGLNALGIASIIGGVIAPLLDTARPFAALRSLVGLVLGVACVAGAIYLLRYMKRREN
jgi:hypothetical protein